MSDTITSASGIKWKIVTLESPMKKRCAIQLWHDQIYLADGIGI